VMWETIDVIYIISVICKGLIELRPIEEVHS
jgi:hypothetical protein